MKKSISVNKKSRGRPKKVGGVYPVTAVRLPPEVGAAVDQWSRSQGDAPTRSEAIRRLVELGLAGRAKPVAPSEKYAAKVKELAAKAIDRLVDPAAPAEERAIRKRRLLKGPEEFREVRVDLSKKK
jgi:Arc/MetJ-type ribon-helix-helix transcriptional regulator